MLRHILILATLLGTSMAVADASAPVRPAAETGINSSIIYKNDVWPLVGPIIFEYCDLEDCSDTPQNSAE